MRRFFFKVLTDQQGIILAIALIMMGLLSALAGAYAMIVRADTTLRGAAGRERQGFYAAESGLNVGMAITVEMHSLVGLSIEGYHHHVNLNTWAGEGAPPDDPNVAGLDTWVFNGHRRTEQP